MLYDQAISHNADQLFASEYWLADGTGLTHDRARRAIESLERKGWLSVLKNGPTLQSLRARWLSAGSKGRRRPRVVRLSLRPPV
jgi:hypothetical protein